MTDTTPLNADDELRKAFVALLEGIDVTAEPDSFFISECLEIVAADRKKHELQARIDELGQVPELKWDNHNHCLDPHHRTDRLYELKQELEKL